MRAELRGNESKAVELQNRATTVYDPLVALAEDEQAVRLSSHLSTHLCPRGCVDVVTGAN